MNNLLLKNVICKTDQKTISLTNREINFTPSLFLYQCENLLNPMQYVVSDWLWLTRSMSSNGGGIDNNITLKSIKVMIKNNPEFLRTQDSDKQTLFHYIFLSPNYDTTNLNIKWVDDLHQQKIEKLKLQSEFKLFVFKEIYSFCKNEIDVKIFESALGIKDNAFNSPFDIMNSVTAFYFLQEGILNKDTEWMEMLISRIKIETFIEEWKMVFTEEEINKVISKVNKFINFIDTRNEMIFMKISGKALPLIPKDVNRYIISKMLHF